MSSYHWTRYFPKSRKEGYRLIVERRGGWEEGLDSYLQPIGLRFPDGSEIEDILINDEFTDQNGNPLYIELPQRPNDPISIERKEPSYLVEELHINDFDNRVEDKVLHIDD